MDGMGWEETLSYSLTLGFSQSSPLGLKKELYMIKVGCSQAGMFNCLCVIDMFFIFLRKTNYIKGGKTTHMGKEKYTRSLILLRPNSEQERWERRPSSAQYEDKGSCSVRERDLLQPGMWHGVPRSWTHISISVLPQARNTIQGNSVMLI